MYTVNVDTSGPIFDGRAREILDDFTKEVTWEITKEGRGDLGVQFIKVFKHPTGYYESQVEAKRPVAIPGGYMAWTTDNDVVYGPWLEGTGSRNSPVTRFPGYWSHKIVAKELDRKAEAIALRHLPVFVERLNGGA